MEGDQLLEFPGDMGATHNADGTAVTDPSAVRAALKRAGEQYLANGWREGPASPSPELLRLLREAPAALAADDPRRRAKLMVVAGLFHDRAHDAEGADACYAEAAATSPNILKRGILADVYKMIIRKRVRTPAQASMLAAPISAGGPPPSGSIPTPRGAAPVSPRPRAGTRVRKHLR